MAPSTAFFDQNAHLQSEREAEEAEHIRAQEEYELQALIAAMEEDTADDHASQHYGSDDDDYDQIFMEYTSGNNTTTPSISVGAGPPEGDAMDMS